MADYLAGRGALPTGWEGATDRARYNVFAWTLLANTGRTSLSQSEFAALSNNEWLQMWADQGEAALGDVYQRECNWVCQNKDPISNILKGIIVAGVAVATAGAAAPALAGTGLAGTGVVAFGVGYGTGAASALASSLTGQTLNQSFSFDQTVRDTGIAAFTGGGMSWLGGKIFGGLGKTSTIIDDATNLVGDASNTAAGVADDAASIISSTARGQSARGVQGLQGYLSPAEQAAYAANPARGSRFLGQAVHRATRDALREAFPGRFIYRTRGVDFVDTWTGEMIELTTPGQVASHMARPGYRWASYATYSLP